MIWATLLSLVFLPAKAPEGSEDGGSTAEEEGLGEPRDFVICGSLGDAAVAGAKRNQGGCRADLGEDF
jgi:hypothetical protein